MSNAQIASVQVIESVEDGKERSLVSGLPPKGR